MIGFNFAYYKPDTIEEAVNLFRDLDSQGKKPIYYGGGTEFISMARMNNLYSEAIIDIKGIAKCNTIKLDKDKLIIGAGVSLTEIAESNHYPLLSLVAKRIADHTIQGKITIGGNMAGTIIYKETLLPLLISQVEITIAGINGSKKISIGDFFHKDIKLSKGDLIVSIAINKEYLELPSIHIKRTKNDKIDYPLITIVAHLNKGKINIAFSGLCKYPFRSSEIEAVLNDDSYSVNERMVMAKKNIPSKVLGDLGGSAEYRKFMLGKMLEQLLQEFQEVR